MSNIIKRENGHQPATFGTVVDQIFQNKMNRFFDDEFWGLNSVNRYQVPVNIRETEKGYSLELAAPGLKKQDFQLSLAADMLTVSYKHSEENKNEKTGWIAREYKTNEFSRSFTFDDSIDSTKIVARYEDGLLKLDLPKKENAQHLSRTINIQ